MVKKALPGRSDARRRMKKTDYKRVSVFAFAVFLSFIAVWTIALTQLAQETKQHLESAAVSAGQLQTQVQERDFEAVELTLARLEIEISSARQATSNPFWRAASNVPLVGPNFSAVSAVAQSADEVVTGAVSPLLENSSAELLWDALLPSDGHIDVGPMKDLSPQLSISSDVVKLSHARLERIDSSELIPPIAEPLEEATVVLQQVGGALDGAAAAATVLPAMLGSEAPQKYLLLIQNSAEVRATGGIPGALAIISADNGQIEMTAQGSATDMGRFDPAVIVQPEQASIYSARMGSFMQSVNLTPDFPTAAQTAARMWEIRNGGPAVDGVVALDPVALSHILDATGPVELAFDDPSVTDLLVHSGLPTSLSSENVVPTLLSDVYAAIEDPKLQDVYFAAVAAEIFDALSSGTTDGQALIHAFTRTTGEGRLYVWSANADQQAIIASTDLAGNVTGPGSGGAAFGAYFNDGTGAKMDYYLRRTVQLERNCTAEGYLQYTLTATLTNTAPIEAANVLPSYVTGGGAFGVSPGSVRTNFVAYGPDRSLLQTARINGEAVPLGSHRHGNRPVGVLTANLAPGETASVEVDFTNVVQTSEPLLDVTPTIQPLSEVKLPFLGDATCS